MARNTRPDDAFARHYKALGAILAGMWSFIHKMGSPPWFFRFSGALVRWLLPLTVGLLLAGAFWGLLVAPPDFRQGNSYRIIYIHVPAAVVALAGACAGDERRPGAVEFDLAHSNGR